MAAEHQCRGEEENFSSEDCDESCFNQHLSWDLRMSWNFLVSKALPSDSLPNCNTMGWNIFWKKVDFQTFLLWFLLFTIAKTNYFKKQNSTVFDSHFYLSSVSVHGHSGHGVLSRLVPCLIVLFCNMAWHVSKVKAFWCPSGKQHCQLNKASLPRWQCPLGHQMYEKFNGYLFNNQVHKKLQK